ncbi:hypothetical protein BLNAU_12055 [Blattamonas nauphoetae]|uniref:Uncharacterized protein n=1 Tax=Blattamonas nauphoetae TaxID=2049346 RepID=A0ABQ9XRK3_9EUKA|nr:hypothetical protein BLNAU_12055 [Blattamonas nauphoetae]
MSITRLPFTMDWSPFLNWSEEEPESEDEKTVVFRSLVATLKLQPALDDSLESKAINFLESVVPDDEESADAFLHKLASNCNESLTDFVQSILVLISSPSQVITTAAMKMLDNLLSNCSPKVLLALVKADLIFQLFTVLNPLSLSFAEAVDILTYLIRSITNSVWLSTPFALRQLGIKDRDKQQAVHETVLQQVVAPLEKYIWHFCINRNSIIDGDQSYDFMLLHSTLLEISPYYEPTMDIVLRMPSRSVVAELSFSFAATHTLPLPSSSPLTTHTLPLPLLSPHLIRCCTCWWLFVGSTRIALFITVSSQYLSFIVCSDP